MAVAVAADDDEMLMGDWNDCVTWTNWRTPSRNRRVLSLLIDGSKIIYIKHSVEITAMVHLIINDNVVYNCALV